MYSFFLFSSLHSLSSKESRTLKMWYRTASFTEGGLDLFPSPQTTYMAGWQIKFCALFGLLEC